MKVPQGDAGIERGGSPGLVGLLRGDLVRHGVETMHPSERRALVDILTARRPQQLDHGRHAQLGALGFRQEEVVGQLVHVVLPEVAAVRRLHRPVRAANDALAARGARLE